MRRILPFVLVGFGVFLVALAFIVRLWVYPTAAVIPYELGDPDKGTKGEQSVAAGTVSVLDKGLVAEKGRDAVRQDVDVKAVRTLVTDLKAKESAPDGDVTVWRTGTAVIEDDPAAGEAKLITDATQQSVCLNRSTSESVAECSESYVVTCVEEENKPDPCELAQIGDSPNLKQVGLQFKFPFNTGQQTYRYFDTTILQAPEIRFAGEEEMDGLTVYRFEQEIPETKTKDLTGEDAVPGILFDPELKKNVDAEQFYSNHRTMWVEPESGQIVKGSETQKQVLRGPEGTEELVVFDGTLTLVDEQVKTNIAEAKDNRSSLRLVRLWAPIGAGVLGGLLIGAGLMLELGYRRRRTAAEVDEVPATEAPTKQFEPPAGRHHS